MARSCLNWKKHERQVAVTWSRMVSWLSKWTPRLDTEVEKWMLADNSWSSSMSILASCCRDPIHITCVFSAFILSLLQFIHASIFSVQLTAVVFSIFSSLRMGSVFTRSAARLVQHRSLSLILFWRWFWICFFSVSQSPYGLGLLFASFQWIFSRSFSAFQRVNYLVLAVGCCQWNLVVCCPDFPGISSSFCCVTGAVLVARFREAIYKKS